MYYLVFGCTTSGVIIEGTKDNPGNVAHNSIKIEYEIYDGNVLNATISNFIDRKLWLKLSNGDIENVIYLKYASSKSVLLYSSVYGKDASFIGRFGIFMIFLLWTAIFFLNQRGTL